MLFNVDILKCHHASQSARIWNVETFHSDCSATLLASGIIMKADNICVNWKFLFVCYHWWILINFQVNNEWLWELLLCGYWWLKYVLIAELVFTSFVSIPIHCEEGGKSIVYYWAILEKATLLGSSLLMWVMSGVLHVRK